MKTRRTDSPKSAPTTAKKTPPAAKKSTSKLQTPTGATKTPAKSPAVTPSATETTTPKSTEAKRPSSAAKDGKETKASESTPIAAPSAEPKVGLAGVVSAVTPQTISGSGKKVVKRIVKRVVRKAPTSAKAGSSGSTPTSGEAKLMNVVEAAKEKGQDDAKDADALVKTSEGTLENVERTMEEDKNVESTEEPAKNVEEAGEADESVDGNVTKASEDEQSLAFNQDHMVIETKPLVDEELNKETGQQEMIEYKEKEQVEMEPNIDTDKIEGDKDKDGKGTDPLLEKTNNEQIEEGGSEDDSEEDPDEFDAAMSEGDEPDHAGEAEALEDERANLNAVARERKKRKELEIFVGGLDRDAVEEDVRKVFQHVGEVIEVRIHKDPIANKNKGYAFVRFETKEQASRALLEMRNPVINGKRCGTAPSEDNDMLFLGNICNTWTKEAIRQKLKDYGVEGVESITLVADPKQEGVSRGFAFVEFSCHADAMLAYKRLQKPDVIFGHPERTAKVAFAEPLREPDPEVMAQVKSVFIDGLPPHWDEDRVREKFKVFGEIARIMLARNMSTAKRKDFGFVDFTTHDAALACIEGINDTELGDGNLKNKVRARLSNPLPKIQAVKGGMVGGFRIGIGGSGAFPNRRGSGRGGPAFNRGNFQHRRGFYPRGPGEGGRMGYPGENEADGPYPPFHGRQNFGRGGRYGFRGAYRGGGANPGRPNLSRQGHGETHRGREGNDLFSRRPHMESGYDRPFPGRQFGDSYFYDETPHGTKRPFFMADQEFDYMGPSRHRRRLDYSDPSVSFRGTGYQDDFEAGGGYYSQDYYASDYSGGAYSSFHGEDRPYGRGNYY